MTGLLQLHLALVTHLSTPVHAVSLHCWQALAPPDVWGCGGRVQCPMIARKFPKESAQALLQVLGDCRNQLNVLSGPKCDALT